jgi:hypothetical protein
MTEAGLIGRLVQAAEEWARRRYRQDVFVIANHEPERDEDGRLQTVVELIRSTPSGKMQPARCIATLEPDGTISCFALEGKPGKN